TAHGSGTASTRHIPLEPARVLDAPNVPNDFYLHLLAWASHDELVVALGDALYVWHERHCTARQLAAPTAQSPDVPNADTREALNASTAQQEMPPTDRHSARTMQAQRLALSDHAALPASTDAYHDSDANHVHVDMALRTSTHESLVTGLGVSADGAFWASGGNDGALHVYRTGRMRPAFSQHVHTSAVKALAWCPWQAHLLASGGGTYDRTVRVWDARSGDCLAMVDTERAVLALGWLQADRELVSAHGQPDNAIALWTWPDLNPVVKLARAHSTSVLDMHQPVDADVPLLASIAADERLKFWRLEWTEPLSPRQ
ncbi:WD40-repeat-containing domain protein, partial [Thamnocephalis sphaerospora]